MEVAFGFFFVSNFAFFFLRLVECDQGRMKRPRAVHPSQKFGSVPDPRVAGGSAKGSEDGGSPPEGKGTRFRDFETFVQTLFLMPW